MKPQIIYKLILAGLILPVVLACSWTFTTEFPATSVPADPATVPPISTPTQWQINLVSTTLQEENRAPNYQIKANVPTLQGSTDGRAVNFNATMTNLVSTEINTFKKNVSELPPAAESISPLSFFEVTYALTYQSGDLWSFKFDFSGYYAGAAHPFGYSLTVNYDLGQGRQLALSDLFLPDANYLGLISNTCIEKLTQRNIGFDLSTSGAAPTPENYRNWNLTPEGLLITFDEGQVTARAAGPQTIVMPYSDLQTFINPEGPLAEFKP